MIVEAIVLHVGPPDGVKETTPLFVVVDQRADIAVFGAVRPALRRKQPGISAVVERRIECQPAEMIDEDEIRHGLEHRHIGAAPTGDVAVAQRRKNRVERE